MIDEFGVVTNKHDRELKLSLDEKGRPKVTLTNSKGKKTLTVSRLVAIAFVENPKPLEYDIVCHRDDNPQNNYYKNLEWGNPLNEY